MPSKLVVHGATLMCSQGTAPSALSVIAPRYTGMSQSFATLADVLPSTNIAPFAMCKSVTNPAVAADPTKAPKPCLPVLTGPWTKASKRVEFDGKAALTTDSECMCAWGGTIAVQDPGQAVIEDE